MKKIIAVFSLLMLMVALLLTGCGSEKSGEKFVCVAMPGGQPIWQRHGANVKNQLEQDGFVVDLQYSDSEEEQIKQLESMIAKKPSCLVIGAWNGGSLVEVLEKAKADNIAVIAFDRLIMNTDAVSYYVSFDNEAVGSAMGQYIEAALNLKSGAGPFNIEVFAGDPNDNNAHLFFSGAMDVLKPYLTNGQLVCRSGETDFAKVSTANWDGKNATARIEKLVPKYYGDGSKIDVILSPNDGVAEGIRNGLRKVGYMDNPILTGQDADAAAMKAIPEGTQTITIYKNPDLLGAKCVRMVKAVVEGTEPTINDVTTYNNGKIVVPSYLCIPMIITKDNINMVH